MTGTHEVLRRGWRVTVLAAALASVAALPAARGPVRTTTQPLALGCAIAVLTQTVLPEHLSTHPWPSTLGLRASVVAGVIDIYARVPGATAAGTGIVLGAGEVVTNNHVVAGATALVATDPATGRTYPAVLLGADARRDVAVISLVGAHDVPAAVIGDSSAVEVGDSVEAVGNIGGNGGAPTVTIGQVTGLRQSVIAQDEFRHSQHLLHGMIRVDASVQPGDSGGPLLDARDEVIGMDTAAGPGAGFAIPINTVLSVARKLERDSPTQDTPVPGPRELAAGDDDISDRPLLGVQVWRRSRRAAATGHLR